MPPNEKAPKVFIQLELSIIDSEKLINAQKTFGWRDYISARGVEDAVSNCLESGATLENCGLVLDWIEYDGGDPELPSGLLVWDEQALDWRLLHEVKPSDG